MVKLALEAGFSFVFCNKRLTTYWILHNLMLDSQHPYILARLFIEPYYTFIRKLTAWAWLVSKSCSHGSSIELLAWNERRFVTINVEKLAHWRKVERRITTTVTAKLAWFAVPTGSSIWDHKAFMRGGPIVETGTPKAVADLSTLYILNLV